MEVETAAKASGAALEIYLLNNLPNMETLPIPQLDSVLVLQMRKLEIPLTYLQTTNIGAITGKGIILAIAAIIPKVDAIKIQIHLLLNIPFLHSSI